jgi:hypothetical protein
MRTAKALVAALGTSLTAATTALAVVSTALGDDAIDVTEIGSITSAIFSFGLTVYAVWRVPNTKDGTISITE